METRRNTTAASSLESAPWDLGTRRLDAVSKLRRDFDADWRRWTVVERAGAILFMVLSIATPMGVAVSSLVH
jgi:hypothetical protein